MLSCAVLCCAVLCYLVLSCVVSWVDFWLFWGCLGSMFGPLGGLLGGLREVLGGLGCLLGHLGGLLGVFWWPTWRELGLQKKKQKRSRNEAKIDQFSNVSWIQAFG